MGAAVRGQGEAVRGADVGEWAGVLPELRAQLPHGAGTAFRRGRPGRDGEEEPGAGCAFAVEAGAAGEGVIGL